MSYDKRGGAGRSSGPESRHIFGFLLSGAIAFPVDAGVLSLGVWLGLPAAIARIPSFLAAVVTTWVLNRRFTFRTSQIPSLVEFLRYLAAMSFGLSINYAVFVIALGIWPLLADWPVLALVPATLAGMIVNFVTSRHILNR